LVFADSVSGNMPTKEKSLVLERRVGNMSKKEESKIKVAVNKAFPVVNYPIGDFLIRLKNTVISKRKEVTVANSKLVLAVAKTLQKEGFLDSVEVKDGELRAVLTFRKKEAVLMDVKLVSKPGLRVYKKVEELEVIKDPNVYILSTPKGIKTRRQAVKERVGGELIAKVL
jgi:small subunit ribosomal protein S8